MKKIGMMVAVEIEAVTKKYGGKLEHKDVHGWDVNILTMEDKILYIVHSGVGEIAAAAAVQMLISEFDVELIVNYGVVGALRADLGIAGTCVVENVVHYDMDLSQIDHCEIGQYPDYPAVAIPTTKSLVEKTVELYPEIARVTCASADKFVEGEAAKTDLRKRFGADICEMEAAGVVLTCDHNHIPNLLIKTVSDSIMGGADEYEKQVGYASDVCLDVLNSVLDTL